MGRRSEHTRQELQELIIEHTLLLVRERGADHVTARSIALAIGYTPGMLYSVFVNLKDIFLHVNVVSLESLYQRCRQSCPDSGEPQKNIMNMGLAYVDFAEEQTHQFDLLFKRMPADETVTTPPALHERIHALFALIEQQLQKLAPSQSSAAVKLGARALWSGVHGTAELSLSRQLYLDTPTPHQDVVQSLLGGFLESWREQPPGTRRDEDQSP